MSERDQCVYHGSPESETICYGPDGYCELAYRLEVDGMEDATGDCQLVTREEYEARQASIAEHAAEFLVEHRELFERLADS